MTGKSEPWAATPELLLSLAEEYRLASTTLQTQGRKRQPLSFAPFRFTAIHAIELYLSAVLLKGGLKVSGVRAMRHELKQRAERAKELGLVLRQATFDHLAALDANREYPVARYGAGKLETASQVNRLVATLNEVAKKAAAIVAAIETTPRRATPCL